MVGAIWRVSTVPVTVAGDIRMLETSNMTLPSSFANPPCSATFAFPPVGAIEKEIQGWSGEDFAAADERLLDLPLGHRSRDLRGIRHKLLKPTKNLLGDQPYSEATWLSSPRI